MFVKLGLMLGFVQMFIVLPSSPTCIKPNVSCCFLSRRKTKVMAELLIEQDTRFWEVFDENNNSLGLFMYGDLITQFTSVASGQVLNSALTWLKHLNYTWKIVGDICPLEIDSDNPIIQKKKIEYRKREREREKKRAKKKGYKLETALIFGKHSGATIKEIIDKYPSYWNWLLSNDVLLLHPETKEYSNKQSVALNGS